MFNALNRTLFGPLDKLGIKGTTNVIAKLQSGLTPAGQVLVPKLVKKFGPQVVAEVLQTIGYGGYKKAVGEEFNPKTDLLTGLAFRGAFNAAGPISKLMKGMDLSIMPKSDIDTVMNLKKQSDGGLFKSTDDKIDLGRYKRMNDFLDGMLGQYIKLKDNVVKKMNVDDKIDMLYLKANEDFRSGAFENARGLVDQSQAKLSQEELIKAQDVISKLRVKTDADSTKFAKDNFTILFQKAFPNTPIPKDEMTAITMLQKYLNTGGKSVDVQAPFAGIVPQDSNYVLKTASGDNISQWGDELGKAQKASNEAQAQVEANIKRIKEAQQMVQGDQGMPAAGLSTKAVRDPKAELSKKLDLELSPEMKAGINAENEAISKGSIDPQVQAPQIGTELENQSRSKATLKVGRKSLLQQSLQSPGPSSPNNTTKTTIRDVERQIYGSETGVTAKGNKTSIGFIGNNLRKVEQGASNLVSRGLESENNTIRRMAGLMQDLSGGAGKSSGQIEARAQYRGGIDYGTKVASDAQKQIYTLLGNNEKSLARVHAVLDPQISKIKVLENDLSGPEREALGTLRILSDFVNDTNYKNGFISKEQWASHRGGKYIARAYEAFDYPPEVADFIKNKDVRFDLNPFKTRGEVTDWKIENAITDPAYLMAKRVQQTMFNGEIKKYTQWASKSGLTSDVAKPGFVQLSDSKAYGDLAGKYIRKDALEDVKGFFLTNDVGQKAYDVLNWYDRNPIRRTQKMLKTVFNPAVRLGNKTGNYVFAWLNGINPVSFAKNTNWANGAIKRNDPLYRYAMQNGLIGTDVTKADIARVSAELSREIKEPGLLKKAIQELQNSYGRVDDASKLASLKTWIDRGVDPAEAINRTRRGFQDYNMVGFLYDLGAKLPILGNPFVRFASESVRIAKNAAVDHPVRTIGTIGAWSLFTDVMSRMQGETPEDKKTREGRVGASHLPFTNISTNIQTPWGEANVSRLLGFSTTFTPEDATYTDVSKYAPIQNPLDVRNYGSDPMIGPLISLATDKDFRGKSISDPNKSKYVGSTLTQGERNTNRAGHLLRSYLPPTATDLYNVNAAAQGKPNVYGQVKSVPQAAARVYPGVKVEQYGPEEADAARKREAYFNTQKMESLETKAKAIQKDFETGKITEDQAKKRNTEIIKEMIPDPKYENNKDAPKGIIDKLKLYMNAGVTDLPATLDAIRTGQPIRKVENDIVVLKRMQGLGKLDFGDKTTEIDHDVPLQYGGSNYDNTLPITDNKQKTIVQKKLYKQYDEGKITKTELKTRIDNWKAEVPTLTATEKKQAAALPDGKLYEYKDNKGKSQTVSIEPPVTPNYTGIASLDKKLKSQYNSKITTAGNNIIKLYEAGTLTADEAGKAMDALATTKKKISKGKLGRTGRKSAKAKRISMGKVKAYKPKAIKIKMAKLKFPKIKKMKIKGLLSKQKSIRVKV